MVSLPLIDLKGKSAGTMDASENLFAAAVKMNIIHDAILWFTNGRRQGTASTKTRGEVRGGGKKPWKQKGTGRARAGTIRSPLWRGGGVMFGPKPRDYSFVLPEKIKKSALRMAISDKLAQEKLTVIEKITVKTAKTKEILAIFKKAKIANCLIIADDIDLSLRKAVANIEKIKLVMSKDINIFDILKYNSVVMDKKAVENLEERLK